MENEVWKDIEGYGNQYQVSSRGRIVSYCRGTVKFLSLCPNNKGYVRASLCENNKIIK